ncbi:rRNA-processing endoribonuclease [Brettanomyces nanus]|uniref:rRNA-processing endoribonuclease n=1 Tax=Eeniella nana TaxID=13502 RepID=A0A875S3B1_EENNA|nr:rRNA-processing endoribonuclease [Brettanomyces nanus]QPG75826.1 rRNA-processing endoribonuclease [Brettanomyces nanus]
MAVTTFQGYENFRLRLVLSTLSGKPIKIEKVRADDLNPGLKDYEISFLRLLESVTNGSVIEISYTGTTVIYRPGLIIGGSFTHNCPTSKACGYFLEPMLYLAPFSKKKFSIVFNGLTSSKADPGLDFIRWGLLPVMEKFGVREVELHTLKRGCPPNGGGEVHLLVNSLIPQPITIHILDIQKISAIRGIAYCARVSPSVANRLVDASRNVLRPAGCEVNITTDVWRGENAGKSPGFGLTLFSESKKTQLRYAVDDMGGPGETPEDLGERVAYNLLELVQKSGCLGRNQLALAFTFMVIGKEDIGRIIVNKQQIDAKLIGLLRDIKELFGTEFFFKDCEDYDNCLYATAKGVGFTNASKKIA